jgi:hypothetical protein
VADIIELEKRRRQHLSEKKEALQDEKIEVLRKILQCARDVSSNAPGVARTLRNLMNDTTPFCLSRCALAVERNMGPT